MVTLPNCLDSAWDNNLPLLLGIVSAQDISCLPAVPFDVVSTVILPCCWVLHHRRLLLLLTRPSKVGVDVLVVVHTAPGLSRHLRLCRGYHSDERVRRAVLVEGRVDVELVR